MNKKLIITIIILIVIIAGIFFIFQGLNHKNSIKNSNLGHMKITSLAFVNNEYLPSQYTCFGKNINPPLSIVDVPATAKSLALTVEDPDAPSGDYVHWLVYNMATDTREIAENSVPAGASVGLNDAGRSTYDGPCPPLGTHHYQFKLYALDNVPTLNENTNKNDFREATQDHVIEQAILTGLSKR